MRFPLSPDLLQRLPRHPDWKYEMVKGEAWLSSRPRSLPLCRPTSLAVPAVTLSGVEIRTLDTRRDRSEIAKPQVRAVPVARSPVAVLVLGRATDGSSEFGPEGRAE
jgi:hypothetical protein